LTFFSRSVLAVESPGAIIRSRREGDVHVVVSEEGWKEGKKEAARTRDFQFESLN